jgi:hypothetical protein
MHALLQMGLAQETVEGTSPSIDSMEKWNDSYWLAAFNLSAIAPSESRLISGFPSEQHL